MHLMPPLICQRFRNWGHGSHALVDSMSIGEVLLTLRTAICGQSIAALLRRDDRTNCLSFPGTEGFCGIRDFSAEKQDSLRQAWVVGHPRFAGGRLNLCP